MNPSLLGRQIATYRKAAGLTQEELGRAVGVSTQAVSRWECGGTPDVALLPAIADRLGVRIDALFGREAGPPEEMQELLEQWLWSLPQAQRMYRLFELLACAQIAIQVDPQSLSSIPVHKVAQTCYGDELGPDQEVLWFRSRIVSDEGLMLSVTAEDFPLILLMPEPPEGYAAHLATNEAYRRLFATLALPTTLELLRYLYGQKPNYYTAASLARRTGLPEEPVQAALAAMHDCHLLDQKTLELEESSVMVYTTHDNSALVPLLTFARWLMEEHDVFYYSWDTRPRPVLSPPAPQSTQKEEPHETTQS